MPKTSYSWLGGLLMGTALGMGGVIVISILATPPAPPPDLSRQIAAVCPSYTRLSNICENDAVKAGKTPSEVVGACSAPEVARVCQALLEAGAEMPGMDDKISQIISQSPRISISEPLKMELQKDGDVDATQ